MPLPSRRPTPPRRPSRHTPTTVRSSPGSFTQTGSAGFGGPATQGIKPAAPSWQGLTPGTPTGTPLPPDPTYDQQVGQIGQSTTNTVSALTGERDRTLLDYGYNVQYDANGNPMTDTLAFDPTNVFSRAAQLRKRWMEARSGTQNGMAAAGQMNSGAYGRAQRQNNYGESQQTDAEMRGLLAFLARNGSQIAGAKIAGEGALGQAESERLGRAATNPLYDPTRPAMAPGGAGAADYNSRGYTTKVGTDSKGNRGEWHYRPGKKPVFVRYQ